MGTDHRIIFVGNGIAFTVYVGRTGHGLQIAVGIIGKIGNPDLIFGQVLPDLGLIADGIIVSLPVPQQCAVGVYFCAARLAHNIFGQILVIGDRRFEIVRRAALAGVKIAGDIAVPVVGIGLICRHAGRRLAFMKILVAADELGKDGGDRVPRISID